MSWKKTILAVGESLLHSGYRLRVHAIIRFRRWPIVRKLTQRSSLEMALADIDDGLRFEELRWLSKQVKNLPEGSAVLDIGSVAGQSTCGLAFGCRMTRKHVYSLWPDNIHMSGTPEGQAYTKWHQNIVRKHLVPYVTPMPLSKFKRVCQKEKIAIVYVGQFEHLGLSQDQLYKLLEHSGPECMFIWSGALEELTVNSRALGLNRALTRSGSLGSLTYGFLAI